MTKHPSRKPAEPSPGAQNDGNTNNLTEEQRLEAARRADFVRELIIGELFNTCLPFYLSRVPRDIMIFCYQSRGLCYL